MIDIAMGVAQDLHFDMARAQNHLLKIALAIAKGGLGLAAAFENLFLKLVLGIDRPHAAPATTPAGFEHEWIANCSGLAFDGCDIIAQNFGGRDDWNARSNRHFASRCLVPERPHGGGFRSDKADARSVAGIDKVRIFRQQAIAGMDRIRPRFFRHPDDLVDAEIGGNRAEAVTDPIGLICFKPVQAKLVFLGEYCDGFFAHFIGGAHNPDGNFTAVCNKDFAEIRHGRPRSFRVSSIIFQPHYSRAAMQRKGRFCLQAA